ncbi:hypothetical protein OSTOST_15169, partial [Ostertagia ostertagi]
MSEPNSRSASLSSDSRAVAPSHRTDSNHPVVPVTSELAVVLSKLGDETAVKGRLPQSTDLFGCAYSYFQSAASRTPAAPAPPPRTSAEAIELPRLAIDATTSWPPRAIMAPVNVLALTDSDRLFVAQIPIRVNNIHVLALVDTENSGTNPHSLPTVMDCTPPDPTPADTGTSTSSSVPGSGQNIDLITVDGRPMDPSVEDASRSPEPEAPVVPNEPVSDMTTSAHTESSTTEESTSSSGSSSSSSSSTSRGLDLSEEALLASDNENDEPMDETVASTLAQSMEDLSLRANGAGPSGANASSRGAGGSRGGSRGGPRGNGTSSRGINKGGRGRRHARRGRSQAPRRHTPPGRQSVPQLPRANPPNYTNYLADYHPWGRLVNPRPRQMVTYGYNRVTNEVPVGTYKHLPDAGYMSSKFARYGTDSTIAHLLDGTYADEDTSSLPLNTDDLLSFILSNMNSEAGWCVQRPVALHAVGHGSIARAKVVRVEVLSGQHALKVYIEAFTWSHQSICGAVVQHGRHSGVVTFVDMDVRLGRQTTRANPIYEAISHMHIYADLPPTSVASRIVDAVYGLPQAAQQALPEAQDPNIVAPAFQIRGATVHLTGDQQEAV